MDFDAYQKGAARTPKRACMHCQSDERELRPYGPGGRDVCFDCTFNGPPERAKVAEERLALQFGMAGDVATINPEEEAGPRAATKAERKLVGR